MLLKIHPQNPSDRQIKMAVECLAGGGIVVYPTDTVYGVACDIYKPKALERIARLKNINLEKANFSFICYDLSTLSEYTRPISNTVYKLMRKSLPGPFTYILEANNNVPKIFHSKKRTIGIRVPDNNIARELVRHLGNPLASTSIHDEDEIIEYTTDPELIHEKFHKLVDMVIDGGYGDNEASTVIDCTSGDPVLVRQGKGIIEELL
ncbi:MAG TPA: L-threonylcarbamoyladenylate synthase [Bacteroidales bacterium]|nr:threonylcarbamoyl-AMP synthase [Paludibacteraceae bacterium]HOH83981.1 L-threonylcarbamoyladenylate synthase [Bacteroidales bacterium]HPI29981.1 L-threonylcarbamoyladenylate synthase [Bacteroidales bacterium]HQN16500.1 L-threonylcarbamoyladenylate synthase [Bacteroidales bacterium]HQP16164.1 L-threonylcarbamoyladenylate synthase [Bacteroidales bacterium]